MGFGPSNKRAPEWFFGHGAPASDLGWKGCCYTDLDTGEVYKRDSNWGLPLGNRISTDTEIGITVDGGESELSPGRKGFRPAPAACTILSWRLLADRPGSVYFRVRRCNWNDFPSTVVISGAVGPALINQQAAEDNALTDWQTSLQVDDIVEFEITAASDIRRVTLFLKVRT